MYECVFIQEPKRWFVEAWAIYCFWKLVRIDERNALHESPLRFLILGFCNVIDVYGIRFTYISFPHRLTQQPLFDGECPGGCYTSPVDLINVTFKYCYVAQVLLSALWLSLLILVPMLCVFLGFHHMKAASHQVVFTSQIQIAPLPCGWNFWIVVSGLDSHKKPLPRYGQLRTVTRLNTTPPFLISVVSMAGLRKMPRRIAALFGFYNMP